VFHVLIEQVCISGVHCFISNLSICAVKKCCNVADLVLECVNVADFVSERCFVRRCCVYCLLCRNFCYGFNFTLFSFLQIFYVFVGLIKYVMAEIMYSKGWKQLVGVGFLRLIRTCHSVPMPFPCHAVPR
jgi:hypothetical protein